MESHHDTSKGFPMLVVRHVVRHGVRSRRQEIFRRGGGLPLAAGTASARCLGAGNVGARRLWPDIFCRSIYLALLRRRFL